MPSKLFTGRRGRIAAGLLVAELSTATQALVIAAIMPRIALDLHALGAYPLAFGSFFGALLLFLPFAGPWADRFGARRVLSIALGLIALGLACAALAPNVACFVAARFVEGAGGGLDYALTFAVMAREFDDAERPRVFALVSGAWVLPAILGPGLGATIATVFGWRWAFAAFLPLIALAAALILPALDNRRGEAPTDAFASLRLLFSRATLRARSGLNASFVALALVHAAFFGADAYVALLLTAVRGLSLETASLCITLAALGWSAAAFAQPALQRKIGSTVLVAAGAIVLCAASGGLLAVAFGAPAALAFGAWTLGGLGMGLCYATISLVALGQAGDGSEGTVSSATLMAALLGTFAGVLVCGIPVALAGRGFTPLASSIGYSFVASAAFALCLLASAPRLRQATP